ncbi:MAG: DUF4188 domain-containing protein [Actinomycetota bacterium]|nr:DUF4188 domain-containing protein [Actinomycetota bacterium]MDQ2956574.1 DUF4188 domain-containing protein [Actinomycetota bacterium]
MAAKPAPTTVRAAQTEPVVVFLIGMRINSWHSIRHWLPVLLAMPPMIREVLGDPNSGCLQVRSFLSGRTILTVQYWTSTEHLMAYAHGTQAKHLPAWRAFNRRAGRSSAVGIFHETYPIAAGAAESVYRSMPAFGLAAATGQRPARDCR